MTYEHRSQSYGTTGFVFGGESRIFVETILGGEKHEKNFCHKARAVTQITFLIIMSQPSIKQ